MRILNRRIVALLVLLVLLVGIVSGSSYYSLVMESNATVSSPPVELQQGTAENCTTTIYTSNTSAKVSVSPSGGEGLGSTVQVTALADSRATAYGTQRKVLRTMDANNTIHVFFIDDSDYIQWYKSTDNGQTFSQAIAPTKKAESLSVAKDNDNYIHLVYEAAGDICYFKLAYNATSWGTPETLHSVGGKDFYYPSIAVAPYNNSWVYVVYDSHTTSGGKRVKWYFTYSTDGGSTWPSAGTDQTLDEYSGYTAGTFPSIVIDNTLDTYGHAYVTWFSGETYLYLRRGNITSTGTVTWDSGSSTISTGMSNATTTVNTNMMHSAVYVNGKYRVVYSESGTAKYRDWNESTWSTPITLATVSNYPSLTYNDNNYLYVFYETDVANFNYDIRYQKSTDTTPTGFGSAVNVTSDNTGNFYANAKVGGDNGRVEFVWTQRTTSPYRVKYNYIGGGVGQGDFNYVLKFVEKDNSTWKVRLKAYANSSITRLDNCSIYIYDGSNSTQIVILNGLYENQTGPWIDLNASDTEYIWMHVETSGAGTSDVYAYLEIRVPNTTTYARYIIKFEIT